MDMIALAMAKAYTDSQRLAYATKETKVHLECPKILLGGSPPNGHWDSDNGLFGAEGQPKAITLTNGKTYFVTTESGTFSAICECTYKSFETEAVLEGESFRYRVVSSNDGIDIYFAEATDNNGGNTFIISGEVETVVPIDPKYLPGVCLPYVELEVLLGPEEVELSEADAEKMSTIGLTPCIIKFSTVELVHIAVFSCIPSWDFKSGVYTYYYGGSTFVIGKDDGKWTIKTQAR